MQTLAMHLIAKSLPFMHALVWQPEEKQIFPVGGNHMLLCNSRDKIQLCRSLFCSIPFPASSFQMSSQVWTDCRPFFAPRAGFWDGERLLRHVSTQFDGSIEWLFKWAVVPGLSGMSVKHMTELSISSEFPFLGQLWRDNFFFSLFFYWGIID